MRWFWHTVGALAPPMLLGALVIIFLREPVTWWLHGEEIYDQEAIKEWIREARNTKTLPELTKEYLDLLARRRRLDEEAANAPAERRAAIATKRRIAQEEIGIKREEIEEFLKAIGNAPTKVYPGQLPLFPIIYQVTLTFAPSESAAPIAWDSQLPRQRTQYRELAAEPIHERASVTILYHLHAYQQRQIKERQETTRRLWLSGLGILFALLGLAWAFLAQRRERLREHQRLVAERQLGQAERRRLEEELRRQDAESKHQEAERQNLELKSQLFANIGIMAGSYAHNIKNLLVRPNDLLRRCLEDQLSGQDQAPMLREVQQTLGTVTERLQQILATIRRDPSKSAPTRLDVNALLRELHASWVDLANEKWKLTLTLDVAAEPLWIDGDRSHLQQALENLVFNARDATFEMRNYLREQARRGPSATGGSLTGAAARDAESAARRQALIDAAAWRGQVVLRARGAGDRVVVEVGDNGIGMTDEVRRRCLETHFSTKRDNALFAGLTAGMGLGLSFVQVIVQHHRATLAIDSQPLQGATFRVSFPAAASAVG